MLERPNSGCWVSPRTQHFASPPWASPAPRNGAPSPDSLDVDFDLIIDEAVVKQISPSSRPEPTVQIDTDIPMRRLAAPDIGEFRKRSKYEVEQMLASPGSLPPPMSPDQREAAIRALLPTATFQMLAKVPPRLLKESTEQAQTLRRKLAHGATVVFVSAGLQGKKFTFERAAALGIKCVVVEHPDSWSRSMVDDGLIAKFIGVDMSQSAEEVFNETLTKIKELGQDGQLGDVDAIATFVELSVPLVARLTEALGLPGPRPGAVDAARNKYETRRCLKAAGLPTPRNCLIHSEAGIAEAGKLVGFPAVLKPVSGAASLGVKKVTSMKELSEYYVEVVAEMSDLVVSSGALIKRDPNSTLGVSAGAMVDLTLLLEQYLDGPEVDVDVVMSNGDWVYAAVADNGPTLEPYFNETWGLCPSMLPKDQQRVLKDLAVKSVQALGFEAGVFHVECKLTSTGPQLIEVNARMGGGQVHECNLRTWGVDLVEETLFAAMGIPARPMVPLMPLTSVAYCYVNASKSGIVKDLSALEELRKREGVVWAKPLTKVGSQAVGAADGLPTWLCDLFVTKRDAKDALSFLLALEAEEPVKVA